VRVSEFDQSVRKAPDETREGCSVGFTPIRKCSRQQTTPSERDRPYNFFSVSG
jgi:hypothetical protein